MPVTYRIAPVEYLYVLIESVSVLQSAATKELGEYQMKWWIDSVVKAIQQIKADDVSPKLQKEFYEKSTHPLDTQQ